MMVLPFADWIPQQRWYAGRGRTIRSADPIDVTDLGDGLDHVLLRVEYAEGGSDVYQVIVAWDRPPVEEFLGHARIGEVGGRTGYDALYQEDACRKLLDLIRTGIMRGDLLFAPEPDMDVDPHPSVRVMDVEQSNTSVVYDTAAILKVFRRVVPGVNPDLELGRALGRAGNPHVAHLLGAIESETASLGTLTRFAANAADGWAMAVASTRDLIADPSLRPEDAGGDFAGEAFRLGEAVASVHATLGEELGREVGRPNVDHLRSRAAEAVAAVPELGRHLDAITDVLTRADLPTIMQRIHGDLHLGQALRTPENWILIDFEGEPGQPIPERSRPDSPMRDVAGMMRSFDYAAHQLLVDRRDDAELGFAATAWGVRNQAAFCDGYAAVAGVDPREHADLLAAYELDKALYEVAYETRYRPAWRWIPMHAVERLLGVEAAADEKVHQ
jgi:maltokinase